MSEILKVNPELQLTLNACKRYFEDEDKRRWISQDISGVLVLEKQGEVDGIVIIPDFKDRPDSRQVDLKSRLSFGLRYGEKFPIEPIAVEIPDDLDQDFVIPGDLKDRIKRANKIHEFGYDRHFKDLLNEEFVDEIKRLKGWYRDENLPKILSSLQGISHADYKRWVQKKAPERRENLDGFKDPKLRAFVYARDKNLGGALYKEIKQRTTGALHGSQGHPNDNYMLALGKGEVGDHKPTFTLRQAVERLEMMDYGIGRELVFSQDYQVDALCAPEYIREQIMRNILKGHESNRVQNIVQSEVERILLIKNIWATLQTK